MPRFVFTFGSGHKTAAHGSLGHSFTEIEAHDRGEARQIMYNACAEAWSNDYTSRDQAGVEKYNLQLVPFEELKLSPPCYSACEFGEYTRNSHHGNCKNHPKNRQQSSTLEKLS